MLDFFVDSVYDMKKRSATNTTLLNEPLQRLLTLKYYTFINIKNQVVTAY